MPRFKVPRKYRSMVPRSTPHLKELRAAYALYRQHPEWWNPTVMDQEDYKLVCKYADNYGDPVYLYIAKGGKQGVSLIEHEAAELEWLLRHGHNPFGRLKQARKQDGGVYADAHASGLIKEHRYLQKLAASDGQHFRLGELIRWNPVSARPARDLDYVRKYVRKHGEAEVGADELAVRDQMRQAIYAWYRSQGFVGRYPGDRS
jgi:hypothetical protein